MQCPKKLDTFWGYSIERWLFLCANIRDRRPSGSFNPDDFFNGNMKVLQPTASLTNS